MPRTSFDAEVSRFIGAMGLLVRRIRAAAPAQGLSLSESAVLGRLAREGPATTASLARAEGVKPQSMGATLAALAQISLIERTPHPSDGRQMLIALTVRGAAVRQSSLDAKRSWLGQAVAQLDEADRATLFRAAQIMARLVEK